MSTSQTSSFVRAQCSFSPNDIGTNDEFAVNRGFASVIASVVQPAGVFILAPDDPNGFDPATDTVKVSVVNEFSPGFPNRGWSTYWDFSAPDANGHRNLVIVTLQVNNNTPALVNPDLVCVDVISHTLSRHRLND